MNGWPLGVILLASACGGSSTEATCSMVSSASGSYTVSACSTAPPVRGINTFTLHIVDAGGKPLVGASISVQPWMPNMNHGSPGDGTPTVVDEGGGDYRLANVVFQMPGLWQLRTTLSSPTTDTANPQFNID